MTKRRNSKKETTIRSRSSGATLNNKFAVFDFSQEDESIEDDAQKYVAKFSSNTDDKYNFLACFAKGSKTQKTNSGNEPLVIDSDNSADGKSIQLDGTLSSSSSDYFLSTTSPDHLKCHSHGERSHSLRARKPRNGLSKKKHSNSTLHQSLTNFMILDVDSDDDRRGRLKPTPSIASEQSEGSSSGLPYECVVDTNDNEAMVVVTPNYVKFGNTYYTKCSLTFTFRCIKLEGSPPWKRNGPCYHEWPTSNIVNIEHEWCESVKVAVVAFHLLSKERETAEIANEIAGIMKLEFVVSNDAHWSEKLEDIKSLDMTYKASWSTITSEYSSIKPFENVIYPDGDPDAISICRRDVEVLQPRTFINDTIIDFYTKFLMNKTNPEEQQRFYFFNTFFFRKLADLDRDSSQAREGREAFQRVHKWTRNINIFGKDYIFIPVNFSLHWSLIVICHPGKVASLRAEETGELFIVPSILHMDSIRGMHTGFENLIRSYLWEEWKDRHHELAEDISTKFLNLLFVTLELPQQENLFDCGLFLLHYAELFLEQVSSNLSLTKCPNFLKRDWFPPDEVSLRKRDRIRKLIYNIGRDKAKKDTSSDNHTGPLRAPIGTIIRGQQTFGESNFIHGDSLGRNISQMASMEQPSNCTSPVEHIMQEEPASSSPEYRGSSHEADGDTKSLTVVSSPSSLGTSRNSGGGFRIIIDEQVEEDSDPQVAPNPKNEKPLYSSMSADELAACVVEDSEEENERQDIVRSTRSPPTCSDKSPYYTHRSKLRMSPSADEDKNSAKIPKSLSDGEGQCEITIL